MKEYKQAYTVIVVETLLLFDDRYWFYKIAKGARFISHD